MRSEVWTASHKDDGHPCQRVADGERRLFVSLWYFEKTKTVFRLKYKIKNVVQKNLNISKVLVIILQQRRMPGDHCPANRARRHVCTGITSRLVHCAEHIEDWLTSPSSQVLEASLNRDWG